MGLEDVTLKVLVLLETMLHQLGEAHMIERVLAILVKIELLLLACGLHGTTCHAWRVQGRHEGRVHPLEPSWHAQSVASHITLFKNDSRVTPTNLKSNGD